MAPDSRETDERLSAHDTKTETVGFRLSPQQEWLLAPEHPDAVVQCAMLLPGSLAEDALRNALEATIARHEILHTSFPRTSGMRGRSQLIHDSLAAQWRSEIAASPGAAAPVVGLAPLGAGR